jgi:hypothetical protein
MSRAGKRRRLADDHDHSPFESIKRRLQSDKSTTRKVRARLPAGGCTAAQIPMHLSYSAAWRWQEAFEDLTRQLTDDDFCAMLTVADLADGAPPLLTSSQPAGQLTCTAPVRRGAHRRQRLAPAGQAVRKGDRS